MSTGSWWEPCFLRRDSERIGEGVRPHPTEPVSKATCGFSRPAQRGGFYPTSFLRPRRAGGGSSHGKTRGVFECVAHVAGGAVGGGERSRSPERASPDSAGGSLSRRPSVEKGKIRNALRAPPVTAILKRQSQGLRVAGFQEQATLCCLPLAEIVCL